MSKRYRLSDSLPFFIPVPPIVAPLGTFGAIISMRSFLKDKKSLFDVGVAGPLAGMVVAIPVLIAGIKLSTPAAAIQQHDIVFYPPLLMTILIRILKGNVVGLKLHPMAFAGYVGIIVTMLNLMPVGQLDGGHITRAIVGKKYHPIIGMIGIVITFLLGWWAMAILMLFLINPFYHPGPLDDITEVDTKRKILGIFVLVLFILCLTREPMMVSGK